ncbi:MAG TPA: hypothetical protein VGN83_18355 [Falsiroseomonas sp.]|nr:hypothetical protein [Falsiroseomonas sp.]
MWLTLAHHADLGVAPQTVLSEREITVLDKISLIRRSENAEGATPAAYIRKIARLGGYLGRSRDPPPGIIVLWRGLSRLAYRTRDGDRDTANMWVIESRRGARVLSGGAGRSITASDRR